MPKPDDYTSRPYDLVLFGATGFTGGLVADYLAANAPGDCRWAIAGRNPDKLAAVRDRLAAAHPQLKDLPLLTADAADAEALAGVARGARVVATTVGPYAIHGEPLVAACAEAGTDYVDLCGEPEFADAMYLKHHARAAETGARLIHACGFDAIPADLGVYYTVRELGDDTAGPVRISGYMRAAGGFSGGTLASSMLAMSRPRAMAKTARARRAEQGRPEGRSVGVDRMRPAHSRIAHAWVLPMPTIDPQIVARSAAALPEYGPDFRYGHYAAVKRAPMAVGLIAAVTGLALAAQLKPLRAALGAVLKPGDGPGEHRRAKSWFTIRFAAETPGRTLVTEMSGGDPGYGETAKMFAESALALAFDDLPATAGQTTTAAAMGDALIARLQDAGIGFRTLPGIPDDAPSRRL